MKRQGAAAASGRIHVWGSPGTVIPHGLLVSDGQGHALQVHWPWWRRALAWIGLQQYAVQVPPGQETIAVDVREVRVNKPRGGRR